MPSLERAPLEYIESLSAEPVLPGDVTLPWAEPVNPIVPAFEQVRIDDTLIVRFEMPGVDSADAIDVQIVGGRLRVKALRREERGGFGAMHEASEFRSGTYARDVDLPVGALEHSVSATYRSGILTVKLIVDPFAVRSYRVAVSRDA